MRSWDCVTDLAGCNLCLISVEKALLKLYVVSGESNGLEKVVFESVKL